MRIRLTKYTITIFIQISQGLEARTSLTPVCKNGIGAEQLSTTIYGAVSVAIHDKESVISRNPSRSAFYSITIMIEQHTIIRRYGFDSISVKIKRQWVSARHKISGVTKIPINIIRNPFWGWMQQIVQLDS